jgi:hypothetical protein
MNQKKEDLEELWTPRKTSKCLIVLCHAAQKYESREVGVKLKLEILLGGKLTFPKVQGGILPLSS